MARTWRVRGGLSATAPATRCAARGPRTPPKLPQSAQAAPTAGARVRRRLRPLPATPRPRPPAGMVRGGGAVTALGPALTRQTMRVNRGRHGREAWAAERQRRRHQTARMAPHAAAHACKYSTPGMCCAPRASASGRRRLLGQRGNVLDARGDGGLALARGHDVPTEHIHSNLHNTDSEHERAWPPFGVSGGDIRSKRSARGPFVTLGSASPRCSAAAQPCWLSWSMSITPTAGAVTSVAADALCKPRCPTSSTALSIVGNRHGRRRGSELVHAAPRACQRSAGSGFRVRTRNGMLGA